MKMRYQVSGVRFQAFPLHLAPGRNLVMLKVGEQAPAFSLPADSGEEISLDAFKGKTLVLFFFPKADTPG